MYKSFTAEQYKKHLGFPDDYKVDGVLCYGTLYEERVVEALMQCLSEMNINTELKSLPHPFLRFAKELKVNDKTIWFTIGYGGAWLSEYLHWACLFGSQKNILVGSCGGLVHGMKPGDFIVPVSSYGQESSAIMYNRDTPIHSSNERLSESLIERLEDENTKIWNGPMVTCQAMIGETLEDVEKWSKKGYFGVEMEASTVFAVSKHFNVPSAASMYIGDNLIEQHSNMSEEFAAEADMRQQKQQKQIRAALEELES